MKKISQRDSNIELLRIIAMVMVLILHADFHALGAPDAAEIVLKPMSSSLKVLLEVMSIGAVNIFVLISGWFTIKPSVKGFSAFIFQWLFFSIGTYVVSLLWGFSEISIKGFAKCFLLTDAPTYWFILSYICLYLFAPVLNAFIKNSSKRELLTVILSFFIFQTIYAFISGGADFLGKGYLKGYSALSFMGLYLLASYIKKYVDLTKISRCFYLYSYLVLSLILSFIFTVCNLVDMEPVTSRLLCYSNPLVIMSSLSLMLYFTQISFKSGFVNSIARSSFAVYLLHCSPFVYSCAYLPSIANCSEKPLKIISVVVLWFVGAIFIDKIRLMVWNQISKYYMIPNRCGLNAKSL